MENRLLKILSDSSARLYDELNSRFILAPSSICECGKPVVFTHPSRKFNCSRCGREYEIVVEVRQVRKDQGREIDESIRQDREARQRANDAEERNRRREADSYREP